jgi:hypothetical protein
MKRRVFGLLVAASGMAGLSAWAHHSIEAYYDDKKPVTVRGVVSKWDWANPHVWVFIDSADARGEVTHWEVEFGTTLDMRRAGWRRDLLKVGDQVTAEGIAARDGGRRVSGRTLILSSGRRLAGTPPPLAAPKGPSASTPRWPDGHVRLNPLPGETGYWAFPSASSLAETGATGVRMNSNGLLANIGDAGKIAPFQPWAKGLYEYRQKKLLADDPMSSCLPPGGPRQFLAPYGVLLLEEPERKRLFVLSGGANRNWRLIPLDGRALPDVENEILGYYGYSTGRWEGDTLVVTSAGYNERFWFSNGGLPHTESLKLTERITRPDFSTLKYEVTVDDAGTYTRPWSSGWTLQWVPNEDVPEYYCDDYNRFVLGK